MDNQAKKAKQAKIGFIFGLVSIISFMIPIVGLVLPILAIIFSVLGLRSIKKTYAILGIVLGIFFGIVTLMQSILVIKGNVQLQDYLQQKDMQTQGTSTVQ